MASRGRDIKVAIISDADQFDVDKPAKELERLGEEALDAKRELDELNDATRANDLDKLGDDAKATATKVDNAFEKIAKSSRSNLRKVDDDTDRAKKSLDDFKDEAHDTGREAAASFSGGFEDITDAVQEIGANAFAKLGKAGMLAGGALAVALGFTIAKVTEANEKIKELRDNYFEFMKGTDSNDPAKRMQEFMDSLDADQINDYDEALRATGISQREFYEAMAEGGPRAKELRDRLNDMVGLNMPWDKQAMEAQHLSHALSEVEKASAGATSAAGTYNIVLEENARKEREATAALVDMADKKHADALGAIGASIRDVGDASGEVAEAVAEDGQVSLKTLIGLLNEQAEAAKAHQANVTKALQEGGEAFAQWVAEQGPEVSKAYAKGSAKERAALRAAYEKNVGAAMGDGIAAGMTGKEQLVTNAAGDVFIAARNRLTGQPILIPVGIEKPSTAEVDRIKAQIKARFGTVTIPVVPKQFGAGRFLPE